MRRFERTMWHLWNCQRHEFRNRGLFITDEMLKMIVTGTNKNIEDFLQKHSNKVELTNKYPYLKLTTIEEMRAFIGLMYFRGLYKLSGHSTRIIFSDTKGLPMSGAVMNQNRFQFLISQIGFDDSDNRRERWKHDQFAAFRDLFELFNDNCSRYLTPNTFMSLDETLYPMRHQIVFKEYNPDKPAKYGMLFKSINSAGLLYLHHTVVYASKPQIEPSMYYNKGTASYVKSLVNGLSNFTRWECENGIVMCWNSVTDQIFPQRIAFLTQEEITC